MRAAAADGFATPELPVSGAKEAEKGLTASNCRRRRIICGMDFGADFVHQMTNVKYDRQSIFEGVSCD
ncbi:hypothetical protein CCR94_21975 [Rhodoblastus sphagnicola]|uniref:Uncharacterized protein n=1 Tax=Rhodoblastus sphagnicola TaxID=333368 RepID=A0A2S6MW83_9HYPH|nr:hypothetical protein CCR94_21975 [Rhodoblastus sphagnicola]